ncbi:hypothetical protein M9H77_30194 [Catharanthus roseus]|uniref:Uncharacterized protein n=1 Tax=Catharanthus roseus TaxID=4058 RepID=A0ACB9ZWL4_CATRO|nr:hypothetical protein M9H77_30194 [Catharanthus roseus]
MHQILIFFTLALSLLVCSNADRLALPKKETRWCIANPGAQDAKLQEFLDYACTRIYCRQILPGGRCYLPNTLRSHTSYALNLYYRDLDVCASGVGILVFDDPSFGDCHYP